MELRAAAATALGLSVACSTPELPAETPAVSTPEVDPLAKPSVPPEVKPEPTAAVTHPDAAAAHAAVQTSMHGSGLPPHPAVHFTPIQDPGGRALHRFHEALRALLAAPPDARTKVRVAVYGASSVAADRYPAYLRGYLQHRFGDGGVGFVALVPLWRWHRHDAVRVDASKHWRIEHGQRKTGKLDGFYGLLGASAHADHRRARTRLVKKTRAVSEIRPTDAFELQFLEQPGGGSFTVNLGTRAQPVRLHTRASAPAMRYETIRAGALLPVEVRLAGDGEVRLMGGVFERPTPGVVVDALGIGGTRSANMLQWNETMWTEALQRRAPALYILAYGANESVDDDEPIEAYRRDLEAVLDRFAAAAPEASCVLVGPVDYPLLDEETQTWGPRPRLRQILQIQRETAASRGCGYFDTPELTGGLGAMPDWVATEPPLAKPDHLHLTPLGYLYLGRVLSDALMADFDGSARASASKTAPPT